MCLLEYDLINNLGWCNIMEEMVYTVAQVASILHVNKNYVYELINKGMIPVLKFKSFRIRKSSLEKFLEKYESYQSND